MIVTWMSWSEELLTMHENRPGLAKDTILGAVRPKQTEQGLRWEYFSNSDSLGVRDTQIEAKRALMEHFDAHEVDESLYNSNPWHK